jgi:hypothetical protein
VSVAAAGFKTSFRIGNRSATPDRVRNLALKAYSSEVDTGSRKGTRQNKNLELRSDSIGTKL